MRAQAYAAAITRPKSRSPLAPIMRKKPALFTFTALAVAVLAQVTLLCAQTLQGGVQQTTSTDPASTGCSESNDNPYAGMNPLVCHGVSAPPDSAGKCSLSGMKVFKQEGNICYYCSAVNPPTPGIIIPINQVAQAGSQGYKCGVDQAEPNCMAVCTRQSGSGPYVPPANTQPVPGPSSSTGGGSPGPAPRGGGSPTPGPPLQGGASANPCQPFGPGGYDYCANPTQPAGCVCTKAQPPGPKGLNLVLQPPVTAKTPGPSIPALDKAMSTCLSAKLSYMGPQSVQPANLQKALASAPASVRSMPFASLPAESQIILEETAMALQAQAVHDQKYGPTTYNTANAQNYMVGWLDHCLFTAGLQQDYSNNSPNDPRLVYSDFFDTSITDVRVQSFSKGYGQDVLPPLPLMPPNPTNPTK